MPSESSHLLVLGFVIYLSYSFITSSVLDTRHFFRVAARASLTIISSVTIVYAIHKLLPVTMSLWAIALMASTLALLMRRTISELNARWVRSSNIEVLAQSCVIDTINTTICESQLTTRLREILSQWGTSRAYVSSSLNDYFDIDELPSSLAKSLANELKASQWLTPKRVRKMSGNAVHHSLIQFLARNKLGIVVSSRGPSPVVIALERRANLKPFTRVEAEQLLEFASLAELAFVKVRLLAQLAHSDRLATLGTLCASFAHEIRNPLFAIRTFAQLLPSHYESPEFRLRFSKTVDEEAGRMEMLLTDMMDLSKPRQLHLEPTHINELLLSMFDVISHRGRTLDTVLEYAMDSTHDFVETDPTAIKQIILNLSANAIQAQKESRRARMLKIATSNTPHGLEIAVSDNGPGIPPRMRKKLFVHYQTGKTDGNGLGLSICRELVTNLGGNLSLDPYVHGIGATFRIVLPMTQDPSSNTTNAKPAT